MCAEEPGVEAMDQASRRTGERERLAAKVEHARAVERVLTRLGWSVLVIAFAGIVTTLVLWAAGEIDIEQALAALLGTVLTSILSGAAAYGAGVNVGLGAERLALSTPRERDEEP